MPKAVGEWKTCPKCAKIKHISNFTKDKNTGDGLKCWCKTCRYTKLGRSKKYSIRKTENIKKYMKEQHLVKTYGMTLDDWHNILEKQGGVCAICKNELTDKICVDHNHITGKVRGLLCDKCNRGIGQFNDNIKILENAIKYLGG